MQTRLIELFESKAFLFRTFDSSNLRRLRRVLDISKKDSGKIILNMLAKATESTSNEDQSTFFSYIYQLFNSLSKYQKIGACLAVGAIVVASIAGIVTYFFKRNKYEDLEDITTKINTENISSMNLLEENKEFSSIEKYFLNNTASEEEVKTLISDLLRVNPSRNLNFNLNLNENDGTKIKYTKSLPETNLDLNNLNNLNNMNNELEEEKKKGSTRSKKSYFSSISDYRKKNEKREKEYSILKKKMLEYETNIQRQKEENRKLKEELLKIKTNKSKKSELSERSLMSKNSLKKEKMNLTIDKNYNSELNNNELSIDLSKELSNEIKSEIVNNNVVNNINNKVMRNDSFKEDKAEFGSIITINSEEIK